VRKGLGKRRRNFVRKGEEETSTIFKKKWKATNQLARGIRYMELKKRGLNEG
jgi:hypothetical protein